MYHICNKPMLNKTATLYCVACCFPCQCALYDINHQSLVLLFTCRIYQNKYNNLSLRKKWRHTERKQGIITFRLRFTTITLLCHSVQFLLWPQDGAAFTWTRFLSKIRSQQSMENKNVCIKINYQPLGHFIHVPYTEVFLFIISCNKQTHGYRQVQFLTYMAWDFPVQQ